MKGISEENQNGNTPNDTCNNEQYVEVTIEMQDDVKSESVSDFFCACVSEGVSILRHILVYKKQILLKKSIHLNITELTNT